MSVKSAYYEQLANTLIPKMEKRNFEVCYCPTKEDAMNKVLSYFQDGSSISWGGSETLEEIGLIPYLKSGNHSYQVYDRKSAKTKEEKKEIFSKIFTCDYFLMSSNAITLDGELVNIDGTGNRVACLCYGPENVIVVVSLQKITKNVEQAYDRIRNIASPLNGFRLNLDTPCHAKSQCYDCHSPACMCCQLVTTRFSQVPKRIKVILLGEECGF